MKVYPLGIEQEINIWLSHKPESVLENETHNIFWVYKIQMNPRIPATRPVLVLINKKRIYQLMDFAVLVKINECKKIDQYWELTRDLTNLGA